LDAEPAQICSENSTKDQLNSGYKKTLEHVCSDVTVFDLIDKGCADKNQITPSLKREEYYCVDVANYAIMVDSEEAFTVLKEAYNSNISMDRDGVYISVDNLECNKGPKVSGNIGLKDPLVENFDPQMQNFSLSSSHLAKGINSVIISDDLKLDINFVKALGAEGGTSTRITGADICDETMDVDKYDAHNSTLGFAEYEEILCADRSCLKNDTYSRLNSHSGVEQNSSKTFA
jgi:hypothetical protein